MIIPESALVVDARRFVEHLRLKIGMLLLDMKAVRTPELLPRSGLV